MSTGSKAICTVNGAKTRMWCIGENCQSGGGPRKENNVLSVSG